MKEKKNVSSGAEKVEKIARHREELQGDAANGGAEKSEARKEQAAIERESEREVVHAKKRAANVKSRAKKEKAEIEAKAARETARAEKRVALAKAKQEKKEARAQAKLERRQRREAYLAELDEEELHRRAERAERRLARREERARRREEREREREREENGRAPEFGGWLAAVITLSVAVLALGAIVTVGYFDMTNTKAAVMNGYQSSVYEFSELIENMDANLAKARVAGGNYEMQKLLTEVLVQSELAEKCLEDFPVDGNNAANLTSFVNRVSDYSKTLLHKLAKGGTLTAEEEETIEYMYTTAERIRAAMPALIESAGKGTMKDLWTDGGDFSSKFGDMSNTTVEVPKSIQDGPFSQGASKKESKLLASENKISESEATERAKEIFASYHPAQLRLTGKTESKGFVCYNFEFKDEKDRSYYAQITEQGGKLALFDSFEACESHNYDVRSCIRIAEKFLNKCGYKGLKPVWSSEAGSECDINFVYEQNGVAIYPDMIKVKVCEEKGVVSGLEAHSYLMSHTERDLGSASVSMEKVKQNAANKMDLHGVRKALIEVDGAETLTYEIVGEHGGRMYYAYVDAKTGETVELFTVVGTDRGNALL